MKRMMKRLSLCLLISSVFGIGTGHSQTCRVHTGCDARGVKQYMEVYQYDYVTEKPEFPGGVFSSGAAASPLSQAGSVFKTSLKSSLSTEL